MENRVYWLSFADPESGENLGCCVVEVNEQDMERAKQKLPGALLPEGPWVGAAAAKAWVRQCNPGGELMATRLDNAPTFAEHANAYPRHKLMTKEEANNYEPVHSTFDDEPSAWER